MTGRMPGDPRAVVLVVEDDPNIRVVICEALTAEGLEVVEARDGEEACRLAQERRPSAVVLDIGLPLLDGAAVADRIRELYEDHVPVIVVTAGWRAEDAARRVRAVAYLIKPFDIQDLVRVVRSAIAPPASAPGSVEETAPGTAS